MATRKESGNFPPARSESPTMLANTGLTSFPPDCVHERERERESFSHKSTGSCQAQIWGRVWLLPHCTPLTRQLCNSHWMCLRFGENESWEEMTGFVPFVKTPLCLGSQRMRQRTSPVITQRSSVAAGSCVPVVRPCSLHMHTS